MLTTLHVSVLTMVARSVHRNSVNLVNMELSLGKLNFLHTRQFHRFFWHHGPAQNPHKVATARPAQDSGCSSNGPGWSSNLFGRFDDAWLPRIWGYQATILHHQDHAGVLAPYLTVHRAYGYINPNCINLGKIKASYVFLCGFPRWKIWTWTDVTVANPTRMMFTEEVWEILGIHWSSIYGG